jgi:Putative peptidoglycan binding domain
MAHYRSGSSGAEVVSLQQQLIRLGFLARRADGHFDGATDLAVREFQRRSLLRADGWVGSRTASALRRALVSDPVPCFSHYRRLRLQAERLARLGEAGDERLPLLDQGLAASPLALDPSTFVALLAGQEGSAGSPPSAAVPLVSAAGHGPYPVLGRVPPIHDESAPGGLSFLSDAVTQACLCIAEPAPEGAPLRVRWYGRRALQDNVQFWSATKLIAPLMVVCQAARRRPDLPISGAVVRSGDGRFCAPFAQLFEQMVSYAGDGVSPGRSNAIGYLFKQLINPGEADVQTWLRAISGNPRLVFLGRYGCDPLFTAAELVGPGGELLVTHAARPRSRNLLSSYDLVRVLTLLGWHPRLDQDQRLPGAVWGNLAPLVAGLGHDTARYIDHALEVLGLREWIDRPVILSKMGFGAETGDPAIDALTYGAFVSLVDRRQDPPRALNFALALRIPTGPGGGLEADSRMGSELIEIVRRLFNGALG